MYISWGGIDTDLYHIRYFHIKTCSWERLYIDNVNNDNDGNNDIYIDTDYDSNDIGTNYNEYRQKYVSIHPFGNVYQMSQNCNKI